MVQKLGTKQKNKYKNLLQPEDPTKEKLYA